MDGMIFWGDGTVENDNIDVPGGTNTSPWGINDNGQIVGTFTDANGGNRGFLLSGSAYTTIDDPNAYVGETWTRGIHNVGAIAGNSIAPAGQFGFARNVDGSS